MGIISYGQIIMFIGIGLAAVGVLAIVVGNVLFAIKRGKIKKELTDKYGF